ncbi:hypothetical protein LguiB_006102 [Lonicera macranthoides]
MINRKRAILPNPSLSLEHRLQKKSNTFGVISWPEESIVIVIPSFTDEVATEDIHIDPHTSLSIQIFLPETCLVLFSPNIMSEIRVPRSNLDKLFEGDTAYIRQLKDEQCKRLLSNSKRYPRPNAKGCNT